MIKFIKKNKLFSFVLFLTITTIIIGLLLPSILDDSITKEINNNLNIYLNSIKGSKLVYHELLKSNIINNLLFILIIWLMGISIIGIPIIIFLYINKVLIYGLEIVFLIKGNTNIIFILLYIFPKTINLFIIFILIYYALNFSIILIKTLILNKKYNLKSIMMRYLKVLIIILILIILSIFIESFIYTNIIKYFI